jgi:tetratricopeptide (TPR) repeat protein
MRTGITYFERAIALDPDFAHAYTGLANGLFRTPLAGELRSGDCYPRAKAAACKALEIDPGLAEARAYLGWIAFWYDWNWIEAERHFLLARELDPNEAEAYLGYAHLLSNTGRHAEALENVKRARELNPLHLLTNALECLFLLNAGLQREALEKLQTNMELDTRFWLTHLYYSSIYYEMGRFAEAVTAAERARALSGGSSHAMAAGACALAKLGKRSEAHALLDEMLHRSGTRYVPPYHFALLYNGLDEKAQAYAWLERGLAERDPKMTFLQVEPKWNNRRSDPGFKNILRRVSLAKT